MSLPYTKHHWKDVSFYLHGRMCKLVARKFDYSKWLREYTAIWRKYTSEDIEEEELEYFWKLKADTETAAHVVLEQKGILQPHYTSANQHLKISIINMQAITASL